MTQYEVAVFARKNSRQPEKYEYFDTLDAAKVYSSKCRLYRIREVDYVSWSGLVTYSFTGYKYQNF